jgi:GGDEF domain-containing protein
MASSFDPMADMMMPSGTAGIDPPMPEGPHGAMRPRPVAGAPPPELADGTAAARAWLLALVAASPLETMGALPAGRVASEGPGLCAAALAALGSDAALARLEAGGDFAATAAGAGRMAGAAGPAATAAALAALREALWSVLEPSLPAADGRHVAALATRLARVCDVVTAAALAGAAPGAAARPFAPPSEVSWPSGLSEVTVSRGGSDEGAAAAVMRRVERRVAEGGGFSLLAVEVDDAGRLLAADRGGAAARALSAAERAILETAERVGAGVAADGHRQWVVAAQDDTAGARDLGERLAAAVAGAATLDGAPLEASIGVAVWPQDAPDAAALLAHADEGVFAARAAGVRVA